MEKFQIGSEGVVATFVRTSAMLVDATFTTRSGLTFAPFARGDWVGRAPLGSMLPGHIRVLGGDFAALPFGSASRPSDLAAEWDECVPEGPPEPQHGLAAEAEWCVVEHQRHRIAFELSYPETDAIHTLRRTIVADASRPRLDFTLEVRARRDVQCPIALHPIFQLPELHRGLHIDVPFARGFTYPATAVPGFGLTAPWQAFASLEQVPLARGSAGDLSRWPLEMPAEEVLLLTGVSGPARLRDDSSGAQVVLDWDRGVLPSLQLWVSDRAQLDPPWNGRYRGIGVEPCASAFDFHPRTSAGVNPLTRRGVRTAVDLQGGCTTRITSSVEITSGSL